MEEIRSKGVASQRGQTLPSNETTAINFLIVATQVQPRIEKNSDLLNGLPRYKK